MIPVVLSGGSGSRLWPVSRQSFPKQFCELLDESLYQKTLKRLLPLGSPWTVTVKELQVLTERGLKDLGIATDQVIYEPSGKNTAPAIAVLCRNFLDRGWGDKVVGIFPADHLVEDEHAFQAAVKKAESFAQLGNIVTLGMKPTYPATGYGYIETSGEIVAGETAMNAIGFREKPNESTARDFIARGGFFWNAGMFIFKISKMAELMALHAPDVWSQVAKLNSDLSNLDQVYKSVKSISIDYAVMERLSSHVCIPCQFEWSDLGSWDAIADVMAPPSEVKNTMINIGDGENFIFPHDKKTYAFVGVEDLIVVDTPDALLITKKGASERVKEVVDQLKTASHASATQHPFEIRPWGKFKILHDTDYFKSKSIVVDPGAQLSYQSHTKRAEHWIIVGGVGEVVLNEETISVTHGKHVYIPEGAKHRIKNTGAAPLEFVEVQLGTYFGEDDIVRYLDDYMRN